MTQTTATAADPTGINRLWRDEHARGIILQLALALGLALFVAFIVSNTIANLQSAGLAAGYGFLDDTASFDINQRLIEYATELFEETFERQRAAGRIETIPPPLPKKDAPQSPRRGPSAGEPPAHSGRRSTTKLPEVAQEDEDVIIEAHTEL